MSEHITRNELNRYFEIVLSKDQSEDDLEFINEIDAHVAECDDCFAEMQAMRLLIQGFSSDASLANALMKSEFPEPLYKPAFDIKKAFAGVKAVKGVLAGKLQILADTLSDKMNAVFIPSTPALAAARGEKQVDIDESSLNNLLHSDMEIPLDGGRKVTLRCRKAKNLDNIRLFVYSNFEVDFVLTAGENVVEPVKKEYDPTARENIWMFDIEGDSFELRVK